MLVVPHHPAPPSAAKRGFLLRARREKHQFDSTDEPFPAWLRNMRLILLSYLLDVVKTLHLLELKWQSELIFVCTHLSFCRDRCLVWIELAGIA